MAPPPQSESLQNQTALELIYAIKGLAQSLEFLHSDLVRKLDESSKSQLKDLEQIRKHMDKSGQSLTVLPITLSDRVEKLIDGMEDRIDSKFKEVHAALRDVNSRLADYTRTTDRAISHNEMQAAVEEAREGSDITGRIEVTEKGDVKVQLNSKVLKKIWYGVIVIATGGGAYSFIELLRRLFG